MTDHHASHDETAIDDLRDSVSAETTAVAVQAGQAGAEAASRRWIPWTVTGCLLVSILTAAAVVVLFAELGGRVDAVGASVSEVRQLAEQAKTAGETANAELARRGQAQVPIPQPGQADDSDVLVAAATARVLASLPDLEPTADQIAAAIVTYVAANPGRFAPSPQQIADTVAAYFVGNPPPSGPPGPSGVAGRDGEKGDKGETGEKGDPPTADEVRAAITALLQDNPDVLCPRGGSFAQLRVQLSDGGTADMWTCVVQVVPSTTTPPLIPLLPTVR